MSDIVSIVIPIYNVEKYLEKCVKSVKEQSYKNLEIILVDDGSTDSCGIICDRLEQTDSRIKVIHKVNGGLASARNAGYKMATGKYIMYIDSDDFIKKDIVERCLKSAEKENADMVIYGYDKIDETGNILETCSWGDKIFNHSQMVEYLYSGITQMSFGYAWNKLYKKSVMDESGILADSNVIDREDLVYNMELLHYINKVVYIEYIGYEYLQRGTSLLHNSNLARLEGIEYFVRRMKKISTGNEEVDRKVFNMNILHYLSDCIIKNVLWNEGLSRRDKKKIMKQIIDKCPNKRDLYYDQDNSRHLRMLYKTISSGELKYFYYYVKASKLKNRIKNN